MFRSESFYVLVLELSGVLIQAHLAHDTSLKKDSVGNIAACYITSYETLLHATLSLIM